MKGALEFCLEFCREPGEKIPEEAGARQVIVAI
jgi:predicted RNase H-like HicB family nuclease